MRNSILLHPSSSAPFDFATSFDLEFCRKVAFTALATRFGTSQMSIIMAAIRTIVAECRAGNCKDADVFIDAALAGIPVESFAIDKDEVAKFVAAKTDTTQFNVRSFLLYESLPGINAKFPDKIKRMF